MNNLSPQASPYDNVSSPQTIWSRLANNSQECFVINSFEIGFTGLSIDTNLTPLLECDDNTDGLTMFNLTEADTEVIGALDASTVSVTYHFSQDDADNNINPLASPYTNVVPDAQTIYVRVTRNGDEICFNTTELVLDVIVNPIAIAPSALEACDDNADGLTLFDLSLRTAEIIGVQTGMTVTYHISQDDANSGDDPLPTNYTNTMAGVQQVYARLEDDISSCFDTTELTLIVNPKPLVGSISVFQLCDENQANADIEGFDLTLKNTEIINGQPNVTVSYHNNPDDAVTGDNPLSSPFNNSSNPQTIYVNLTNTITGCSNVGNFELIVNPLPLIFAPTPLEVCDDGIPDGTTLIDLSLKDAEITGGDPTYAVTYHLDQSGAESGASPLPVPYQNEADGQEVYARVEDTATGCYATTGLILLVEQAPVANAPSPIEFCDPDSDGYGVFDLGSRDAEVTGGDPSLEVSYHETAADAMSGSNPLSSPYVNINIDSQTVYVRVESGTIATDCASFTELQLTVSPTPQLGAAAVSPLRECDGPEADGIAEFDLTDRLAEILQELADPSLYTVRFYEDATEAELGDPSDAIASPFSYSVTDPFGQTLTVRVEDNATGCFKLTALELVVDPLPVAVVAPPLEQCDDDVADGLTVFDLTDRDAQITGGEGSSAVAYYETLAQAELGTGAVADPTAYTNTSVGGAPANPQTLWAVVTDTGTGCTATTTLTIRVLPRPTPTQDMPELVLCDETDTGDLVETFDLTADEPLLLNGEAGVTASYHETLFDAQQGQAALADPSAYENTSSPQVIYARVANGATGCYAIVEIGLRVDPLPTVPQGGVEGMVICELGSDGAAQFDLAQRDAEILDGQDPALFTVTYHDSQGDADALEDALGSPYANTSNPQVVYVAVTDNATGCSISTLSFELEVQEAARANADGLDILLEVCDDAMEADGDPSNDSAQFDLTPVGDIAALEPGSVQAQVLDGQDPADYAVSYYASEAAATEGGDPLPFLYENLVNPQVIWARVDNDTEATDGTDGSTCYAVAPVTLRVNPLPLFRLDERYVLCVGTNGTEAIDAPVLDTGLSAPAYGFQWTLDGTDIAGATGGSYVPTGAGTYGVTVTDLSTSAGTECAAYGETEVIESGPPAVTAAVTSEGFAEVHTIAVTATGDGVYEYSLDGGPWRDSPVFTGVSLGGHEVTARDRNGCGLAGATVTVLDYPAFFTPNGDGYNDRWDIAGMDLRTGATVFIFDRFGKLLKQMAPGGRGWDGTYNGSPMPTSDYWFMVEYGEPATGVRKEFKAHFTLKR